MFCRVGIVAGEAASNGDGLGVGGVHAAVFGGNHFGQFVGVGGFEFRQAAVLQDDFRQGVVGRELFEHGFIGGNAAFGSFFRPLVGMPILSNRISCSCLGELRLNGWPATA